MWLLITYILILSIAPGPVFIKTVQEARIKGTRAGIYIALGASIAGVFIVIAGLIIHSLGFSAILDSSSMFVIEQIGAIGIILMGIYAGYQCLTASLDQENVELEGCVSNKGIMQGMGMMLPTIPHGLLFYNIIVPQTVELNSITSTIIGLGVVEVVLIFGYHAIVAFLAGRSQRLIQNVRVTKVLDFSLAILLVGMGVNILF